MSEARFEMPAAEYKQRIEKVQSAMQAQNLDLLVAHACGCESATVRYLTDFWAVFDFAGVLIPASGQPVMLTGGPESYDFAVQFAQIPQVRIHPLYVETSAPQWDKPAQAVSFSQILAQMNALQPLRRIGIANVNTIPHVIYHEIEQAAPQAQIVAAEGLIMALRAYKSPAEINLLRQASRITEEALKQTIPMIRPGIREWEIQAQWMSKALQLGAEGTSYPCWVTSGPNTYQSLCKSTDRPVAAGDMVQLSLGAKYHGYCGNTCRAVILGKVPPHHMRMIQTAYECLQETIARIKPGVGFAQVYDHFQQMLQRAGFEGQSLYGPAHSTGLQECEDPWVDNRSGRIFEPNMVFNVDIWIADDKQGVRIEDGVLVTQDGCEELTSWQREPLILDV